MSLTGEVSTHDATADEVADEGYRRRLGARLGEVRRAQGLSPQDVERVSAGRFPAALIGAYERGARPVATDELAALAAFYGVPVPELLPDDGWPAPTAGTHLDLHLSVPALRASADPAVAPLARLVDHVRARRGNDRGQVISLRADDLCTVAVELDLDAAELPAWLARRGLVAQA